MGKRKHITVVEKHNLVEVKVTGLHCAFDGRRILPGETAKVPAEIAQEWITAGRAVRVTAEVQDGDGT